MRFAESPLAVRMPAGIHTEKKLALELNKVGVVGAGVMGRGIAQVCAAAGCGVRLFDASAEAVSRALAAVRDDFNQGVQRGKMSQADADAALARIVPAGDMAELADRELVVEAIIEQLDAKQQLMGRLEAIVGADCILATNTSSLSVTAIAACCAHPERVAGWHFFNPVPRMKLVEVVQAPRTRAEVVQALASLSKRVGHRAVVTPDSPGFVVNHAGRAFVTEGLKLLAERCADPTVLDAIMRTAGFRMGPFELLDLTALDVSVPVMESIHAQYYGDDRYRPVALARTRMLAGLLGRKSGQGFYDHGGQAKPTSDGQALAQQAAHSAAHSAAQSAAHSAAVAVAWQTDGPAAVPAALAELLAGGVRCADARMADVFLIAPLGPDLSSTVAQLGLDAAKTVAVDPLFASPAGVTLMVSPATTQAALEAARALFAAQSVPAHVVSDSPGYVAPRIVACIVNLACEMAQQGIASPADIDAAVKVALAYPMGAFEWGDRLGAKRVLQILEGLYGTFGDPRYRPSPWLARRARLGLALCAPDRHN